MGRCKHDWMKYQTEGNEVQIADCIKSLSPPLGDLFVLKLSNSEGLGKKALYCNFTGTDIYHKDFDSALVTTEIDYELFAKNLDELFTMSMKEYDNIYLKHQKYYMNYPKDNHTYQAISDKIDLIIERSKFYTE